MQKEIKVNGLINGLTDKQPIWYGNTLIVIIKMHNTVLLYIILN